MEPRGSWSKPGNDYNRRNCTPGFPLIFKQPWEEGVSPFPSLGSSLREAGWLFWSHITSGREAADLSPSRPDRHCNLTAEAALTPGTCNPLASRAAFWGLLGRSSLPQSRLKLHFCSGHPFLPSLHHLPASLTWPGREGELLSCHLSAYLPKLQRKTTLIYDWKKKMGEGGHRGRSRAVRVIGRKEIESKELKEPLSPKQSLPSDSRVCAGWEIELNEEKLSWGLGMTCRTKLN